MNFLFSLLLLLLLGCSNEENTDDTVIASEDELFDVYITERDPDGFGYAGTTGVVGFTGGTEGRLLIQIPQFLNLYQEEIITSSVAEISLEITVVSVPVNPENIRLRFIGTQWSPFATWNSTLGLREGFVWETPGGDFLDLDYEIPHIEKDGTLKRLKFDITSQVVESLDEGIVIYGFAVTVVESDLNAEQDMTAITFNHESGTAPRATLSFSKSDIVQ